MKKIRLKKIVISLLGDSLNPLRIELALLDWITVFGLTLVDGETDATVPAELPALVAVEAPGAARLEVFSPEVLEPLSPEAVPQDPLLPEPPLPTEAPLPQEFSSLLGDPPLAGDPTLLEIVGTGVMPVKTWVRVQGQLVMVKVVG
jgi:hypothetical protein